MAAEDTIENPFAATPEGRDHARQIVAARLAENEDDHRMLIRLRDHLAGQTPIGEALSFFYGESRLEMSDDAAPVRDLEVAERVVIDFFKDPARYREAWEQGSLSEMVATEASRFNRDRFGAGYVGTRLSTAFEKTLAAQHGAN